MSPRWTFGIPGLALFLIGALAFAIAFFGVLATSYDAAIAICASAAIVLGYQAVMLAVFAKFIAIEVGLHPSLTKFWRLREPGTLERFLIAGGLITVASLCFTGIVASQFSAQTSSPHPIHLALLAVVSLIAGGQTIIAGFCLGLFQLVSERREFPRKRATDQSSVGS